MGVWDYSPLFTKSIKGESPNPDTHSVSCIPDRISPNTVCDPLSDLEELHPVPQISNVGFYMVQSTLNTRPSRDIW